MQEGLAKIKCSIWWNGVAGAGVVGLSQTTRYHGTLRVRLCLALCPCRCWRADVAVDAAVAADDADADGDGADDDADADARRCESRGTLAATRRRYRSLARIAGGGRARGFAPTPLLVV